LSQPEAVGPQQQHCVPQQMQQIQQGMSFYNKIPQVQLQNHQTFHSNYLYPTGHQEYPTFFPALPEKFESLWQKVEHKKKFQRDNSENHTQNVKEIKLQDYWFNQPLPPNNNNNNNNKFDALSDERNEEKVVKTNRNTFKSLPTFVAEGRT
jgi:hypothetical protein